MSNEAEVKTNIEKVNLFLKSYPLKILQIKRVMDYFVISTALIMELILIL